MHNKKVLVLGGTGAMGVYLVPQLLQMGYTVHVVSLDQRHSSDPNLVYTRADASDPAFLDRLLKGGYGAIVDFLLYGTEAFRQRYRTLLENTDHYIYLSSYRVYADSASPITENTPRLLDLSEDRDFLASEDYALYKARGEDLLTASPYGNWTAVRPAITYSKTRFQLVTLEANVHVCRMAQGKKVVLPREALEVQGTMTWAGDVAKMIARLLHNPRAYREFYTVATAEHRSWGEIAGYYQEIGGMEYVATDLERYLEILTGPQPNPHIRWQLLYDRMFQRVIDNAKILDAVQMKQSELMPLREGLERELTALPAGYRWPETPVNQRMDAFLSTSPLW